MQEKLEKIVVESEKSCHFVNIFLFCQKRSHNSYYYLSLRTQILSKWVSQFYRKIRPWTLVTSSKLVFSRFEILFSYFSSIAAMIWSSRSSQLSQLSPLPLHIEATEKINSKEQTIFLRSIMLTQFNTSGDWGRMKIQLCLLNHFLGGHWC